MSSIPSRPSPPSTSSPSPAAGTTSVGGPPQGDLPTASSAALTPAHRRSPGAEPPAPSALRGRLGLLQPPRSPSGPSATASRAPSIPSTLPSTPLPVRLRKSVATGQPDPLTGVLSESLRDPRTDALLAAVQQRAEKWRADLRPFAFEASRAVLDTLRVAEQAGLPAFDNAILLPTDATGNWVFHFKPQEQAVVVQYLKWLAPGHENAYHGYVCNQSEGNQFGLRALTQELAKAAPEPPVYVASVHADPGVEAASEKYGVPLVRLPVRALDGAADLDGLGTALDAYPNRPVIFVATLGTRAGGCDSIVAARSALEATGRRFLIHADATRHFPSGASDTDPFPFTLLPGRPMSVDSVVAAGLTTQSPAHVVTLKPKALGAASKGVSYIRGVDATPSGSRPAMDGLTLHLLLQRFGLAGFRAMAAHSEARRQYIVQQATTMGLGASAPKGIPEVRLTGNLLARVSQKTVDRWELRWVSDATDGDAPRALVLSVHAGTDAKHIEALLKDLHRDVAGQRTLPRPTLRAPDDAFPFSDYAIPAATAAHLHSVVDAWRDRAARMMGYPGAMSTQQRLSSIIRPMLHLRIPETAVREMLDSVIQRRLASLGAQPGSGCAGTLTSGSTTSNQVGVISGLAYLKAKHPGRVPFLYISQATHYSGDKIGTDNAELRTRYRVIETDTLGRMVPEALERQLQEDFRAHGWAPVILLTTRGTTFAGGSDDVGALCDVVHRQLGDAADALYVLCDGALGFGPGFGNVRLAQPGQRPGRDGEVVRVHWVTVSNHKFAGLKVSGLGLGVLPPGRRTFAGDTRTPDPMATFQVYLYDLLVSPEQSTRLMNECLANTASFRAQLQARGRRWLGSPEGIITVIDHPPVHLLNRYGLAPEGDKAHQIHMSHVTPEASTKFLDAWDDFDTRAAQQVALLEGKVRQFRPTLSGRLLHERPMDPRLLDDLVAFTAGVGPSEATERHRVLDELLNNGDGMGVVLTDERGDGTRALVGVFLADVKEDDAGRITMTPVLSHAALPEEMRTSYSELQVTQLAELFQIHMQDALGDAILDEPGEPSQGTERQT
jgi:glutamate/tyrosine decarboxylase-like PLP-dependent enzyme